MQQSIAQIQQALHEVRDDVQWLIDAEEQDVGIPACYVQERGQPKFDALKVEQAGVQLMLDVSEAIQDFLDELDHIEGIDIDDDPNNN